MKRKLLITIAYVAVSVFLLTGCGFIPSLEVTDEQRSLIAEYAAGKLIEYVKGHPGGLMILEDVDRADVNPGLQKEEPEPTPGALPGQPLEPIPAPDTALPDEVPEEAVPGQDALVETPEGADAAPTKTIAEALGLNGATVTYDYYEITSTYPENAVELAFSMKAAKGKELLVTHFTLANPGDSDIDAYSDSSNFKVRLLVNGSDKIRGDVTFLDNDLMNYRGLLTPGSTVDSVLVFEVPSDTEITSMDLIIVVDDAEQIYKLL
jgi:hypothetical protein